MKTGLFAVIVRFLLFTSLAAAWPWPPTFENVRDALIRRQDSDSSSTERRTSTAATPASTGSRASASATARATGTAAASSGATASGTAAASASGSGSVTGTQTSGTKTTKSGSQSASITDFDPRLPPGGIEMIEPAATDPTSYYKIGDYVTFKWNYTSLSITPTAIDIMATCTANAELYTIAANQSVQETGAVTWDTGEYATGTAPLLTESYTLIIYDADSSVSATAKAGYLGTQSQYVFAMYSKQPYTPLNQFRCATCSGALSDMERHALGFTLSMACITLLSFTWFVGGFSAIFGF